jgi:uncharacterized RDD family membrane protein YckC
LNPAAPPSAYPGEALGRPQSGPGSVAGIGRRLVAVSIDWAMCLLIADAFIGTAQAAILVFLPVQALLVGTAGGSLGHRLFGMRVETTTGAHPGLGRASVRALLLSLVLPALIWDHSRRGLHDRAAGTVLVRTARARTAPPRSPVV